MPGAARRRRPAVPLGALVVGAAALASPAAAQTWPVENGEMTVLVPLEPGGAFEARTSSLEGMLRLRAGTPLQLAGEIEVDLAAIDTGIGLRNEHMRERLELEKGEGFARAVLSEIALEKAADAAFRGETPFTGTLLFHGESQQVSGKAKILAAGASVRVEANFVLDLRRFAVEPPFYMGVGVTNRVVVNVAFSSVPR